MIEALPTLGGIGGLAVGVWLWRAAKIAMYLKMLAVATVLIVALSLLGVIELSVNLDAVADSVRLLIDLVR